MEFKGTKGKWAFINNGVSDFSLCAIVSENQVIAHVNPVKEDKIANAQLISKAPELLEELKHVVRALKTVSSFGATTGIIEHAEALIKSATGSEV